MKFTVKNDDFKKVASRVVKGVTKDPGAVLSIRFDQDKMKLTAYSVSTFFDGEVGLKCDEELTDSIVRVIEPNDFKAILSVLPPESKGGSSIMLDFETEDGIMFVIRYGSNKLNLRTSSGDIVREEPEIEDLALVDGNEFLSNLDNYAKIIPVDPTNVGGQFYCLHLFFKEDGTTTLMGTDRVVIAEGKMPLGINEEKTFLLRSSEVSLLGNKSSGFINLIKSPTKFGYKDDLGRCMVSVVDESPVDYVGVHRAVEAIPHKLKIRFKTSDFEDCLTKVSQLDPIDINVYFDIDTNGSFIKTSRDDKLAIETDYSLPGKLEFSIMRKSLQNSTHLLGEYFEMLVSSSPAGTVMKLVPLARKVEIIKNDEGEKEEKVSFKVLPNTHICISVNE